MTTPLPKNRLNEEVVWLIRRSEVQVIRAVGGSLLAFFGLVAIMIWVFWRDWDVYSSKAPFALAVSIICLISGTFVCIRARTHAKRYQRVFRGIDWDRTDLSDPHMMQFQRGHVGLPTSRYEAYSLTAGVFSKSVATTTYSIVFITVAWLGVGVLVAMGLRG